MVAEYETLRNDKENIKNYLKMLKKHPAGREDIKFIRRELVGQLKDINRLINKLQSS